MAMSVSKLLGTVVLLACIGYTHIPHAAGASDTQLSVDVSARVTDPIMLAGKKSTNYVRISLTGFEPSETNRSDAKLPPVNVAIVIDNSSSMGGRKIQQARQAAIAAIDRLRETDIVSIVLYNSSVQVLVPATKATDPEQIKSKIKSVQAGGSTALFAGVSKGAAEVRKFLSDESVNRVILLSDGQANVGPSSPRELARLGSSLVKEGISVSTLGLGLGYNEDLMSDLAASGSGNHIFVEEASDLVSVFQGEFNDLLSVVATDFKIHIEVAPSVRPVRVLGTEAEIVGQDIHIPLAQLYSGQQRYFVIEVEVPAGQEAQQLNLLTADVRYRNLVNESNDQFRSDVTVRFTNETAEVESSRDLETYAYCSVQIANEKNRRATALRDAGQIQDAKDLLRENQAELQKVYLQCEKNEIGTVLPDLQMNISVNAAASALVEEKDWSRNRKAIRARQNEVQSQQKSYSPIDYLFGGSRKSSK